MCTKWSAQGSVMPWHPFSPPLPLEVAWTAWRPERDACRASTPTLDDVCVAPAAFASSESTPMPAIKPIHSTRSNKTPHTRLTAPHPPNTRAAPTVVDESPIHHPVGHPVADVSTCRSCMSTRLLRHAGVSALHTEHQGKGDVPSSAPTQTLVLGVTPSTAHDARRSGRHPSVSTNAQPGESEKVRLLLCKTNVSTIQTYTPWRMKGERQGKTHLTSPPTPLHPSLALVHPTRSFGFKLALDHVPPVPLPPSPPVAVGVVDPQSSS